jgi:uncharacterized cupin superfamily protein
MRDGLGTTWLTTPQFFDARPHYPYDQAVVVLHGNLKLRETDGREQDFKAGSTFLLPRGFKGLWIMEDGNYEELIVVERSTFLRHE